MSDIEINTRDMEDLVQKVKTYFEHELDQEIGGFDAEFLVNFFAREIGPHFYNQGLYDAQAMLSRKMDEVTDLLYELEKPTEIRR